MKRFDLLVQEVRDGSDSNDSNSYSIWELQRYFNDGQKLLQKMIHTANTSNAMFSKFIDLDQSGGVVDLPIDVYAKSSINSVGFIRSNNYYAKLKKVEYSEFDNFYGYTIHNDCILVPERNSTDKVRIDYVYKIPQISYRLGKIESIDLVNNTITVSGSSIIDDTEFNTRYEYFSVVDKKGVQTATNLYLDEFTGLTFDFEAEADISGVSIGEYVVCGASGTSHSHLPEECQPYIMKYVERAIRAKLASSTLSDTNAFTEMERSDFEDLFKDVSKDQKYPVATDLDFLEI